MPLTFAEVLDDRNRFRETIARLEAENAALRELAQAVTELWIMDDDDHHRTALYAPKGVNVDVENLRSWARSLLDGKEG